MKKDNELAVDTVGLASSPESVTTLPSNEYAMVLLVDDQALVAEAIRRMLAGQEIDFHYCANPADAIDVAERVKPTVILQDLVMPGVDGLVLVRQYRANRITRDIPIIVLSSKEDPLVKREAFVAGANDYLVKPCDRIELVARLRHHSKARMNQLLRDEVQRALRESQRQLIDSNTALMSLNQKLEEGTEARSKFLANVGRDIRTPMDAIMTMTNVLLDSSLLTKEQLDIVESIRRSGAGQLAIIDDLFDFLAGEASHRKP